MGGWLAGASERRAIQQRTASPTPPLQALSESAVHVLAQLAAGQARPGEGASSQDAAARVLEAFARLGWCSPHAMGMACGMLVAGLASAQRRRHAHPREGGRDLAALNVARDALFALGRARFHDVPALHVVADLLSDELRSCAAAEAAAR